MIVHHPHETSYTVIQNATLCDSRLSWKARGLLAFLLSKPDGWTVIVTALVREAPDGKRAVMAGLDELEQAGYLQRLGPTRGAAGRFDGSESAVYEQPLGGWPEKSPGRTVGAKTAGGQTAGGPRATIKDSIQQLLIQESTDDKKTRAELSFDACWESYPRKQDRKEALRAFTARLHEGVPLADLHTAVENYAESVRQNHTERQFVMLGKTFFGPNERWETYLSGPILSGAKTAPSRTAAMRERLKELHEQERDQRGADLHDRPVAELPPAE